MLGPPDRCVGVGRSWLRGLHILCRIGNAGPSTTVPTGAMDLQRDGEVAKAICCIIDRLREAPHSHGGHRGDLPE